VSERRQECLHVPLLLRIIKASSSFLMILETKETMVSNDPGSKFANDLAWTKVCGVHKSASLMEAVVELHLIVDFKICAALVCVVKQCKFVNARRELCNSIQ
jgi:hypothetical protein